MLEWLKRLAWKAGKRQKRFAGSNPACSAKALGLLLYATLWQRLILESLTGVVAQAGTEADLGIENLAGGKCFVLLYKVDDVIWKLVVASPWDVRQRFINDGRYDVNVFLED